MNISEELLAAIDHYLNQTATSHEKELVNKWYHSFDDSHVVVSSHEKDLKNKIDNYIREKLAQTTGVYQIGQPQTAPVFKLQTRKWIAAASIMLIAGAGLFYFTKRIDKAGQTEAYTNDIAPGKMGATLTLSNGKKIKLSDASTGELAKEAGLTISKSADGQIVYSTAPSNGDSENRANTLSTAKGETYVLTLSDKTQVWLNAASSLTYSATLNERGQRRVKLSGEAYFQVSKDKAHPFIVETDKQEVEVLGTHFNVNAYKDEPAIRTTLLEGRVRVAILSPSGSDVRNREERVLKPNQQSVLDESSIKIKEINAEDAIAWKNGLFVFEDESLEAIMRRVSRWYNVEVIYSDDVDKKELYGGSVSRYENVSSLLRKLEVTGGIHFKIEGRRVFVRK